MVQWSAMIKSAVAISLINKELGGKLIQFLSILICLTIPMGILQSTSTQTDYVTSLWITILIYFIFRYKTTSLLNIFMDLLLPFDWQ